MPIEEKAINSALAAVIMKQGIHATPEATNPSTGTKRCDVQIKQKDNDLYFTAVECKIGQGATQQRAAAEDAKRWYELLPSACWNAISVCYPERISTETETSLDNKLSKATDLLMARVDSTGVIRNWRKGGVAEIIELASDVEASETHAITTVLKKAIEEASLYITTSTGKELAEALRLPWQPKKGGGGYDVRPALISCLILANMALLQCRMKTKEVSIPGLSNLNSIKKAVNIQKELIDNWQKIRAVDYVPVVDPALLVLDKLPTDHQTNSMLGVLIEAVLECSVRIRGLQLDHAGPIYHGLLETAKYDGSYYTSTAAAVLLANLAMPRNWSVIDGDWKNIEKLASLKICDPACGTGTLLMAAAKALEMRFGGGSTNDDNSILHLYLIENVLHGLDINPHAIHLAASMLTISAPKIDYNKMNLYNMEFGSRKGTVRVGSLDILVEDEGYLPGISPDMGQNRASGSGYEYQTPDIKECDLVIMNPPFTRNSIRYLGLPDDVRAKVKERERSIAKGVKDSSHQEAIHTSTIFSFFSPIADKILKEKRGTLAIVQPISACMGAAAKGYRKLLTDPCKFHVDMVVTSHDNNRICFSENTDIHECLVVASRPSPSRKEKPTAFISLERNPADASEARFLAEAINNALESAFVDGDVRKLSDYGTITHKYLEHSDREWNAACFYDHSLADYYNRLVRNPSLSTLKDLASIAPDGRAVRGAFDHAEARQSPDMRALWNHETERQVAMRTTPDLFIVSKKGKEKTCRALWEKRGRLLVANRLWLNSAKVTANFSDKGILGSAFVPVAPFQSKDSEQICKAWCVWLNSTFGIICFLNKRSKKLTYPAYSLDALRSISVPNPDMCDIEKLAATYEKLADATLKSFSEINLDSVRRSLDEAVVRSVPGLEEKGLDELRETISLEPSVSLNKDPYRLK